MDLIRSTFSESRAEIELIIKPASIMLVTPPLQPVLVFVTFVRDGKTMYTSSKYTLQPQKPASSGMAKLVFNDGDMFKTINKYYGSKNKWDAKEVQVNVLSEGGNGKVQTIGTSRFNLAHFVSQYFNQP